MQRAYELVTAQIVAELEKGTAPWVKPWKGSGVADLPYNAATDRPYNSVNLLLLFGARRSSADTATPRGSSARLRLADVSRGPPASTTDRRNGSRPLSWRAVEAGAGRLLALGRLMSPA